MKFLILLMVFLTLCVSPRVSCASPSLVFDAARDCKKSRFLKGGFEDCFAPPAHFCMEPDGMMTAFNVPLEHILQLRVKCPDLSSSGSIEVSHNSFPLALGKDGMLYRNIVMPPQKSCYQIQMVFHSIVGQCVVEAEHLLGKETRSQIQLKKTQSVMVLNTYAKLKRVIEAFGIQNSFRSTQHDEKKVFLEAITATTSDLESQIEPVLNLFSDPQQFQVLQEKLWSPEIMQKLPEMEEVTWEMVLAALLEHQQVLFELWGYRKPLMNTPSLFLK